MAGYEHDPSVDEYLDAMPEWQRRVAAELRDLIHEADAGIRETIKRRVQPYFVLDGTNRAGGWRALKPPG